MEGNAKSIPVKDEIYDALKELDLNIDVDVAYLAGQTPPVKIFPTQNTSHLSYKEQVSLLESDYLKHYSYRGDLKYNENMARSIKKEGKGKCTVRETCMYRVCRDKNRFFETRLKDDVLILGKIFESMIERTSRMENRLEMALIESGEKKMPNWDDIFNEGVDDATKINAVKTPSKAVKRVAAAKRKVNHAKSIEQKFKPKRTKSNNHSTPETLNNNQAQMLVAQMMLERSFGQNNRIQLPPAYIESAQPKKE